MTFSDKYTVVFDGNHFLHKTLHVVNKIAAQEGRTFNFIDDPEADKNLLLWKLSLDYCSEIKKFSSILENVVYAIDSSSWRKEYFPEEEIEKDPTLKYKGTRKYKEDFNWNLLYKAHDEFAKGLSEKKVKIVKIQGSEADDIVFAWSTYLNSNGKNCLIISGDNDLLQLVNLDNSNGTNTLYYHKNRKKIYSYSGFSEWLSKKDEGVDIFNQPISLVDNTKDNLKAVLKYFEIEELNSEEFQFTKILVGDQGDNVKPLYSIERVYRSGKKEGETWIKSLNSTESSKILSKFKETYHEDISESLFWNFDYIKKICSITKKICKLDHIPIDQLIKNYEDNRNLMILNNRSIPPSIMEAMLSSVSTLHKQTMDNSDINELRSYENVLEKTTYSKETKSSQNTSGFFGSFDLQ
jgi:5'-3' exonuclease